MGLIITILLYLVSAILIKDFRVWVVVVYFITCGYILYLLIERFKILCIFNYHKERVIDKSIHVACVRCGRVSLIKIKK